MERRRTRVEAGRSGADCMRRRWEPQDLIGFPWWRVVFPAEKGHVSILVMSEYGQQRVEGLDSSRRTLTGANKREVLRWCNSIGNRNEW